MSRNAFWITVIIIAAIVGALFGPSLMGNVSGETALIIMIVFMLLFIGLIVFSLSGNKGGKAADAATTADARALRAPEGKGRIYVVRRGFVAALQGMNIAIDGVGSGQLKSKRFIMADVEPGTYQISSKMARGTKSTASTIDVTVAAGQCVVVSAYVEMTALAAKTIFTVLDDAQARSNLADSKMLLIEPV